MCYYMNLFYHCGHLAELRLVGCGIKPSSGHIIEKAEAKDNAWLDEKCGPCRFRIQIFDGVCEEQGGMSEVLCMRL